MSQVEMFVYGVLLGLFLGWCWCSIRSHQKFGWCWNCYERKRARGEIRQGDR